MNLCLHSSLFVLRIATDMKGICPMPFQSERENKIAFTITLHGLAAAGATSPLGKNASEAAAAVIQAAQALVNRVNNPLRPLALGFANGKAGRPFQGVRDKVQLMGTLCSYDDELLLDMVGKLKKLARHTAETFDCSSELVLLLENGAAC